MAKGKSEFWGNVRSGLRTTAKHGKKMVAQKVKRPRAKRSPPRQNPARKPKYITVARRGNFKAIVTPWGKRWRVLATGKTYATFGEAKREAIKIMNQIYTARRKKGRR